jgi:hypothetical protein
MDETTSIQQNTQSAVAPVVQIDKNLNSTPNKGNDAAKNIARTFSASEIHKLLNPKFHNKKLTVVKDNIGIRWTTNLASSKEVRQVLASEKSYLLFPQGEKESYYPAEDYMLDGLTAKVTVEGVLFSYYEGAEHIKKYLQNAKLILDSGIGTGTMTFFMLINANPEASIILTDAGESAVLALINLAKAGYDITIVPHRVSINQEILNQNKIGQKKVIFTPWSFDSPMPGGINNIDLFMGDNSIVYTNSIKEFEDRVKRVREKMSKTGVIVLTELNSKSPAKIFKQQKMDEIKRSIKRVLRGQLLYTIKMIGVYRKALPIKQPLQNIQLGTDNVAKSLDQLGQKETIQLMNGVTLMYILNST